MNLTKANKILLAALLLIGLEIFGKSNAMTNTNNSIILGKRDNKKNPCRMFQPDCTYYALISRLIPQEQLYIFSSDEEIFTFKSIDKCDSNCSLEPFESFNLTRPNITHIMYKITIKPGLIGGASLIFFRNSTNDQFSWEIIINQPKRIVDRIFDVWVWVFGSLVSALMGVLIDRESLLKIIKMPKAVIIGFSCQYVFMPLVKIDKILL